MFAGDGLEGLHVIRADWLDYCAHNRNSIAQPAAADIRTAGSSCEKVVWREFAMVGTQKLIAAVAILSTICVSACATRIGRPDPDALASYDFGAAQEVKLCVYLDNGVTREQAENKSAYSDSVRPTISDRS